MRGVATTRPEPVVGNKHCPLNQKAVGLPGPRPAQTYRKVVEEVTDFTREELKGRANKGKLPLVRDLAAYALALLDRVESAEKRIKRLDDRLDAGGESAAWCVVKLAAARLVVEAARNCNDRH